MLRRQAGPVWWQTLDTQRTQNMYQFIYLLVFFSVCFRVDKIAAEMKGGLVSDVKGRFFFFGYFLCRCIFRITVIVFYKLF